jgi:hypothetical protein
MNNSSAQGQLFYQNITSPQQAYAVYAVQNCDGPEGVNGQYAVVPGKNNQSGSAAISNDMVYVQTTNPNGCHSLH